MGSEIDHCLARLDGEVSRLDGAGGVKLQRNWKSWDDRDNLVTVHPGRVEELRAQADQLESEANAE